MWLLIGCAGEIKGHVFLDKNGNGIRDTDEPGLGKVLYDVTLDGAPYTSGMTDEENGSLIVPTKGDKGDYCINVKNTADTYLESSTQPTVSSILGKAETTATTEDDQTADNSTDTEQTDEQPKDTTPVATEPLPPNCVQIEGYTSKVNMDIAIAINMSDSIGAIPQPETKTVLAGDKVEICFYYPRSCKILNLKLPEFLAPAKKLYSTSGNTLSLSTIEPDKSQSIKPYSLTSDVLTPKCFELKASAEQEESVKTIELKPKILCPDGTIHDLWTQKLTIKKERKLNVKQEFVEKKAEFEKSLTLKTVVENKSLSDYHGDATLTIVLPDEVEIESFDESCRNLLEQIQCDFKDITAGSKLTYMVKFKLPKADDVASDYLATIHTEIKFYGEATPMKVEPDIKVTPKAEPAQEP